MKNFFILIGLVLCSFNLQSQAELTFAPYSPFSPYSPYESYDCYYCYGISDISTGMKLNAGIGLVKELSPRFDLVTNLGFGVWTYKDHLIDYSGIIYDEFEQTQFLFNLSIGERFHLFQFENASIYSGLNLNFQLYTNTQFSKKTGLSLEPTIGLRRAVGKKGELFFAAGYDQHLSSFHPSTSLSPGKLAFDFGFNFLLKKKEIDTID